MAVKLELPAPPLSSSKELEHVGEGIDNGQRVVVFTQSVGENGNSRSVSASLPEDISQEVLAGADSWTRCRIGESYYNVMYEMVLGLFGIFPEDEG